MLWLHSVLCISDLTLLIFRRFLIEGASDDGQQGATFSNPMDSLYRDILNDQQKHTERVTYFPQTDSDHNRTPRLDPETDPDPDSDRPNALNSQSEVITHSENQESASVTQKPTVNQPIGRVTSCRSPVTVSGTVEEISDEEIRDNRETEDGIRRISRFQNYQRGEPSNVGFLQRETKQIIGGL